MMEVLLQSIQQKQETVTAFPDLPRDYKDGFNTVIAGKSIHQDKIAGIFPTNQQPTFYNELTMQPRLEAQISTPQQINDSAMDKILDFPKDQYDSKPSIEKKGYKYQKTKTI